MTKKDDGGASSKHFVGTWWDGAPLGGNPPLGIFLSAGSVIPAPPTMMGVLQSTYWSYSDSPAPYLLSYLQQSKQMIKSTTQTRRDAKKGGWHHLHLIIFIYLGPKSKKPASPFFLLWKNLVLTKAGRGQNTLDLFMLDKKISDISQQANPILPEVPDNQKTTNKQSTCRLQRITSKTPRVQSVAVYPSVIHLSKWIPSETTLLSQSR